MYVDGLNLYHGIRSKSWPRYQWLDMGSLGSAVLNSETNLVAVKYFVAKFMDGGNDDGMVVRQDRHLQAVDLNDKVQIFNGEFQKQTIRCEECGFERTVFEEKLTDVNIAVELICDAEDDLFDIAIVVSGDADLAGPIMKTLERHPDKSLVVAFPPARRSRMLEAAANGHFEISRDLLRDNQLPDILHAPNGFILRRPDSWQ